MTPTFRNATTSDWSDIWPVFRAVVASGDTYTFDPDISEAAARSAWLFDGSKRKVTYVAELDGRIIGTAILKPNQPGLGDHVANAAWMVHPDIAGRGVGRRFAIHVIDDARRIGFEAMQFNAVVASNHRAVRLWESLGFSTVGRVPLGFRHKDGPDDLLIMHRSLRTEEGRQKSAEP